MTSFEQRLRDLNESAAILERDVTAFTLRPHARARGTDARGTVSIEWDDAGPRLTVAEGWERAVPAEELELAVGEAMSAALAARYSDDGIRLGDEEVESVHAHLDSPVLRPSLAADPAFTAAIRRPDFAERLREFLAEEQRRAALRRRASGPAGIIAVVLDNAGEVSGFRIDAEHARGRRGSDITSDAASAVSAARARFSSADPALRPADDAELIGALSA